MRELREENEKLKKIFQDMAGNSTVADSGVEAYRNNNYQRFPVWDPAIYLCP